MSMLYFLLWPGLFVLVGFLLLVVGLTGKTALWELVGTFFLLIGLAVIFLVVRSSISKSRMKKNGRKVWAMITEAIPNEEPLGSGSFYISVHCEAEGWTIRFSTISTDPESLLGKTVPVIFP